MDMTITFVMNHPTFQSNSSKVVRQIFHDIWKKCSSGDTQGPINMNGVIIGRWDTAVGNLREKPNMVITFEIEGIKINADEIHRILDEIVALRRPRSLVVELDEGEGLKSRQDRVLDETAVPARRQLIVE